MIAEASAAAMQVAVMIAPKSMPVGWPNITPDSTAGCTKMMQGIVRNVVTPATTSVLAVVPFCRR
ncbi:MAG: hypothetical protein WBO04_01370 [Steroidobacteraceae bacterium]